MNLTRRPLFALTAITLLVCCVGCSDRDPAELEVGRATTDPLVFGDEYNDVYWQPFFRTHYMAASYDSVWSFNGFAYDGARSLRFNIPPRGSSLGPYTGGVLTSTASRDLADYTALTLYARASRSISLNTLGFGNDNTGTSLFEAGRTNVKVTGDWTQVIVPIPAPSKIVSERGLLTFAEEAEQSYPEGYDVWIDEVRYAKIKNLKIAGTFMSGTAPFYFVGSKVTIGSTATRYRLNDDPDNRNLITVNHSQNYLDFESSNPEVVSIVGNDILVVGTGEAILSATLENPGDPENDPRPVDNTITVVGLELPEAAPKPTVPAGNVVSLFSDAYDDVPVDTWRTEWSNCAPVEELDIDGNTNKLYTNLVFVGVEFLNPTLDASAMTHFHVDVYAPTGTNFKVKLVSFPGGPGAAGVNSFEPVFDGTTTPAFTAGQWSSLEIPLSAFQVPEGWDWSQIGQLVFSTNDAKVALVDNVYFHK